MMGNVETKTFELGVLRMVGLTRWGIIQYLLIQSMTYALPAWMIGLGGAQGLFVLVKKIVYTASKINVSVLLSPASIAVSTVLGIAVPVLAAILPIRKALGNNLRDSLDKRANKTKAILITIQRNEPGSIRGMEPLIASGTVLIVAGFAIYYLLPMSLLNGDITLLFNIFFAIILGMLFGLVMLSINLQPLVERLIIWIMFDFMFTSWMFHERGGVLFFEGRAIKKLLGKNLLAHKLRNRKTSTAFSFALGFIVFLASNLNVQFFSLQYASIQGTACDFQVYTDIGSSYTIINMDLLDNYLSTNHPYIQQYSWISQPLLSILSNYENDIQLETMARISKDPVNVRAVSPNFIENFYIINPYIVEINQMSPNLLEAIREGLVMGITEGLYADVGDESALMSSYLLSDLGLGQDISNISSSPFSSSSLSSNTSNQYYDPVILRKIHYTYPYTSFQDNVIRPMGFMDHVGFVYMTDQPTNSRSDLLVSFPTLVDLTGGVLSSVEDVNIQAVLIYLDTNLVNNTMRNKLWIELQSIMTANHVVRLQDQLDSTSSSLNLMNLIFTIATGLIMLITLFSLNICMMTNIWEQKGEIGVLRALGVKKWAIFRLYVYEAFIIVSSSGFLGLMIGTCVGWTMSLQQSVQSGQPIFFPFPVNLAVLVLAGSVVSALISTFAPIYALLGGRRKKIVGLLKG